MIPRLNWFVRKFCSTQNCLVDFAACVAVGIAAGIQLWKEMRR